MKTDETTVLMKAIRVKCMDCSGDSQKNVEQCPVKGCALYPFRHGKKMAPSPTTKTMPNTTGSRRKDKRLPTTTKGDYSK